MWNLQADQSGRAEGHIRKWVVATSPSGVPSIGSAIKSPTSFSFIEETHVDSLHRAYVLVKMSTSSDPQQHFGEKRIGKAVREAIEREKAFTMFTGTIVADV